MNKNKGGNRLRFLNPYFSTLKIMYDYDKESISSQMYRGLIQRAVMYLEECEYSKANDVRDKFENLTKYEEVYVEDALLFQMHILPIAVKILNDHIESLGYEGNVNLNNYSEYIPNSIEDIMEE